MTMPVTTRSAEPGDLVDILALNARVFGPGRFTRTAYRVREGTRPISPFCRIAVMGGRVIASLRFTEIVIGETAGALLLGPLAVDPAFAGKGYGRQLVAEALAAARTAGLRLVVLVGDEPYYARFGFHKVPPGLITLPGPVAPDRLLAAELTDGALADYRGAVRAAPQAFG
jgi:predicted N-acetyltransferase YhbS